VDVDGGDDLAVGVRDRGRDRRDALGVLAVRKTYNDRSLKRYLKKGNDE